MATGLEQLAEVYKALSEVTRLEILAILHWGGELCVCDIEAVLEITQSKASRHLRYLYHAGLVESRRRGTWTYYRLPDDPGGVQSRILALVRAQVEREDLEVLQTRLEAWLERKQAGTAVCASR